MEGMERRVLLAIVLAFLVLYASQTLFIRPVQKPGVPPIGTQAGQGPLTNGGSPQATADAAAASAVPAVPPASSAETIVGESSERDIRVETNRVIAIFTNRGARLRSWRLKGYRDAQQQPLELIANDLPSGGVLPFELIVDDDAVTRALDNALYAVKESPQATGVITETARVSFEYRDSAGVRALKEFSLEPSSFVLTFSSSVSAGERTLSPTIVWGPALGDIDAGSARYAVKPRGLLSVANSVQRLAAADVTKQATNTGDYQFAGVDDHYFLTSTINPGRATVSFQPLSIPAAPESKGPARDLMSYAIRREQADATRFFIGPKDFNELAVVDTALPRAIDFGRFSYVVISLLRALNWIHGYIGNYGWAIIILTVLINAVMFPLRHKSVVSMRKMQEIQPEAKRIQDRYAKLKATDPAKQKMNEELMALYRERGVNPASGCVPMLLTLPVLFAFYALLTTAIELRGAPFFGWIHDLSLPDPFYITPVLMGISQIWQTRITPQAGTDPTQQKMMMFMPVMFMFFFLWAPAGVAIYWLVSNVWGIGQQYLTNYLIGPPNIRAPRPPAERRVKRVATGEAEAAARE